MKDWGLPFEPYKIQYEFMESLYSCISEKKIGIFESPTGTGKTLSLICSSLYWLCLSQYDTTPSLKSHAYEPSFITQFKKKRFESEGITSHIPAVQTTDEVAQLLAKIEGKSARTITQKTDISLSKRVIYCSRTHSQLKQVLQQVSTTKYLNKIKALGLGSRNSLCINDKVKQGSSSLNELNLNCQELVNEGKCPFYPSDLSIDYISTQFAKLFTENKSVVDIESLFEEGKTLHICPYYSSFSLLPSVEFVAVPYNFLLHPSIRKNIFPDLRNSIVIFDEAHNLVESIKNIFNQSISLLEITNAHDQLKIHYEKYILKFKGANQIFLRNIILVLKRLEIFLLNKKNDAYPLSISISEFFRLTNLETINVYELAEFVEDLQVSKKALLRNEMKVLSSIFSFLTSLSTDDSKGRLEITRITSSETSNIFIKYLLLHVADYFQEIVDCAHSVVLAGGTISPMEDIKFQLFNNRYPDSKFLYFSCGHIIDSEKQLRTIQLSSGPTGIEFKFTFEHKGNADMLYDTFQSIVNFARIIPDGLIVFFPSYVSLTTFISACNAKNLLPTLGNIKKIFIESSHSFNILDDFISTCDNERGKGAILFAVINGKLSEGINFSNHYGRGVIVVGLPFPDTRSFEVSEMLKFLQQNPQLSPSAYLENICMRGVNQAIGRAIRNAKDYAVIILLDIRYSKENIYNKLPKWIIPSLQFHSKFGEAYQSCSSVCDLIYLVF